MFVKRQGMMFVLSSPSGAGKTTLTRKLAEQDTNFSISISYTTRKPRPNEINGKDYYFVSKREFEVLIKEINQIIKENHIKGIVIGNPINMDGTSGKSSQSASDFAKNLSKNITIPIAMWDERLSSEGSFKITKVLGTNVSNRVNKLDKNAAAFILQGAIDYLSN